jgi:4-hydroxybenzoate polyprenyltransferase
METIGQIAQFIRWRDWGPGKLTILWSLCFYIALAYAKPFNEFALTFLVFMIFAAAHSALGYVMNNWGDRELDRKQFKPNPFNGRTQLESTLALTMMLLMAFVTGLPLALRPGFGLLWFAWVASAAAYSIEPFRLKTRGAVGLAVSFVAQWFLPVLLTFSAFDVSGWDMWVLALALSISGATLEIAHQRYDRERDRITRATTFAAVIDERRLNRIYTIAVVLDKLAIGSVITIAIIALLRAEIEWGRALAVGLGIAYLALLMVTLKDSLDALAGRGVDDPYYGMRIGPSPSQMLHETLLNFALPVCLGVAVTVMNPLYGILLALFLLWRLALGGADLRAPLLAIRSRLFH